MGTLINPPKRGLILGSLLDCPLESFSQPVLPQHGWYRGSCVKVVVFNPTVQILNLDDFADVYEIVKTERRQWKPLGRKLLKNLWYVLDSIESNAKDDEERLCKTLNFWLTKTDTLAPSWRSLKEALTGIGREDLAGRITDSHTHGEYVVIDIGENSFYHQVFCAWICMTRSA